MKHVLAVVMLLASSVSCLGQGPRPLLLQSPTLSKTQIAFAYGGDIWIVGREGGTAQRLVTGMNRLTNPIFSPDGSMIAYTGEYDGNVDVYVVLATGGDPRRLTYHPGADVAVGWTPDGKSVLFHSHRASPTDSDKLFTVPADGGLPTELPLPMAEGGSYSPDGTHLAYSPFFQWEPDWKGYRGGQTTPIWIADLADSSVVPIPRDNSNDKDAMWVDKTVYFLSDRNGPVTLFAYDTGTHEVSQVLRNDGFDIKSASAGPGAIVYEQFGSLYLYDLAKHESKGVQVRVAADMPQVRPHFVKVATATQNQIQNQGISPTGVRAVFEAHGEILTVPAEKGAIRNITQSPAAADRDPAWSPDGKSIAYFSDQSGEYALYVRDQNGTGPVKKIDLGSPSFFYTPTWSPDSKKIAYSDKRLNLWYVDLGHPTPVKVDTDLFDTPLHEFDVVWSPDSKWLAYGKQLLNHLRAAFVYSLENGKATRVTDGMSDVLYPNFDKNGKYLYFTASTDMGLSTGWLDMTSVAHPVTRSVYAAVLRKDLPSPVPPESDEEKGEEAKKTDKDSGAAGADQKAAGESAKSEEDKSKAPAKKQEPVKVSIDFENILQRIVAMPIPAENYQGMWAGKEGILYLVQAPQIPPDDGPAPLTLQRFELKTRKTDKLLEGISSFALSFDGEKMLYQQQKKWYIAGAEKPPSPGKPPTEGGPALLKTDDMEVYVDPRAEWTQMYHEVWRIERDFFYDPHYHGLNLEQAEKAFAPYLDRVASRSDLSYLFREMLSYMSVGHMFVFGGAQPDAPNVQVGLLGADYNVENGRYRFAKVYNGENWNPQLHAPLTEPGVNVKAGEYLLAVNGRELHASDNLYSFFQETAGKATVIKVGPNADGSGSREVTVVPIPDEAQLRHLDWIEGNRRKVDELSGGKLAYVHLPDTASGGFTNFNRYYFSQVGKEGAIIDERFNHGGDLADYIVDHLRRPLMSWVMTREGESFASPSEAIFGPKVMIVNQFAGSGGDALPWYFRKMEIGPLVGTRTWGGLIGIGGYPQLMDGGSVMAPRWAIYGLKREWEVENHGIAPDIEVWQDPKLVREGHDPQLEKAVDTAMEMLKKSPPPSYPRPPYPDFHPHLPAPE
ncbi:MAG TPA: PDZ domain-containing protein [Terriglobia bacterium]|nr:PDZ domain-containing protein [Terriglobia bacterium]